MSKTIIQEHCNRTIRVKNCDEGVKFIIELDGTEGRTRTGTVLLPSDFESDVSTSFTTPAVSED